MLLDDFLKTRTMPRPRMCMGKSSAHRIQGMPAYEKQKPTAKTYIKATAEYPPEETPLAAAGLAILM
jgi:hypothetical protein